MPATKEYVYRHTEVNRFQLTGHPGERPFDFKNHLLRIAEGDDEATERRNERFLELASQMHPRDRAQIRVINAEAAANLERALGPRVSRGAQDTSHIRSGVKGPDGAGMMTQAQIDELAEQQRKADEEQEARNQAAINDANDRLEKERIARVAAEEEKLKLAGQVDESANQKTEEEKTVDPAETEKPAPETHEEPAAPVGGLQQIKSKK